MCRVSRAAVGQSDLPLVNGKIDTECPEAIEYMARQKEAERERILEAEQKKRAKAKHSGKRGVKAAAIDDGTGSPMTSKQALELKKLEQQGINLELKNMQLRGLHANVKFYDQMFHTQLAAATKNFMNLPNACVDDIISVAMTKGTDARAEIVADLTEQINEILEDVREAWVRNYDRAEADIIGMLDDE
jgi:hypothetical protein